MSYPPECDLPGSLDAVRAAEARLIARADKISDPAVRASFLENVPDHARTLALAREWRAAHGQEPATT